MLSLEKKGFQCQHPEPFHCLPQIWNNNEDIAFVRAEAPARSEHSMARANGECSMQHYGIIVAASDRDWLR